MTPEQIESIAEQLAAARSGGAPIGALARPPSSEREAYALQEAVHQQLIGAGLGDVVGHKIGCTTPVMQDYLGIDHPCAGGILAASVHHGHGALQATRHHRLGVECEIAVRLGADVLRAEQASAAVASIMPAIEVVEDRYADFTTLSAMTLTADDFFGAGCVLGDACEGWHALDLGAIAGTMTVNGEVVGQGIGADILGHPLNALRWLAELRIRLGQPLLAGEFVLLGSVVKTAWIAAGDDVAINLAALGGASLSLR